jgi:hypothetical protein
MTDYAHVTDGTVDQVGLPEVGTLSDGRAVSGYDRLPAGVLAVEGWLPVTDDPPAYDAARQSLTRTGHTVTGDTVRVDYDLAWLPPSLTVEPSSIPADGTTPAVATYTHPDPDTTPAEVTFTVNGATSTVALSDGTAELEVTPSAAGDIAVSVDQDVPGVTITVQEA